MITDADIEKAAKAIAAAKHGDAVIWRFFINHARAALEAVGYESGQQKGKIAGLLYRIFEMKDADEDLLSIIGSYGDTLDDEEIVSMLESYIETGSSMIDPAKTN